MCMWKRKRKGRIAEPKDKLVIPEPPRGEEAIVRLYGRPWVNPAKWESKNLIKYVPPPKIAEFWASHWQFGGEFPGYIRLHRVLEDALHAPLEDIVTEGLASEVREWNGVVNLRRIRGGSRWSMHSFGAAIDLMAHFNPLGKKPLMHKGVVKIFESYGWVWGGDWGRPDGQHFQYGEY